MSEFPRRSENDSKHLTMNVSRRKILVAGGMILSAFVLIHVWMRRSRCTSTKTMSTSDTGTPAIGSISNNGGDNQDKSSKSTQSNDRIYLQMAWHKTKSTVKTESFGKDLKHRMINQGINTFEKLVEGATFVEFRQTNEQRFMRIRTEQGLFMKYYDITLDLRSDDDSFS